MKKSIRIGDVQIPLDRYVIGGTAVLGIRDSGKTYAAKGIAEQILDAEIPIVVFDPIGRWRFLRMAGFDSRKPKGYKIVVAGGEEPDLPLTPQSAPEIIKAAIKENIPLVLDFYDRRLSKSDWRRIVQVSFRTLMYENKGVRHLFVEEAAEFVPQKVMDGETYAEVEKVVRMGGNVSLGVTLINQRAQEVNKAVLDLCENVVLLKQRGSHAIDSLERLIDRLSPDRAAEVIKSLPHLGAGEGWLFTPKQEEPHRIQTGPINSFHPDRRKPQLSAKDTRDRATNTKDFVSRLTGLLETVISDSLANDPAALRRRIQDLEKRLAATNPDSAQVTKAYQNGRSDAARECRQQFDELLKSMHLSMDKAVGTAFDQSFGQSAAICAMSNASAPAAPISRPAAAVSQKAKIVSENGGSVSLPKGEAAILRACIMYPELATREALTVMTGYKRSSRDEYVNRLRARGFVQVTSAGVVLTEAGKAAIPDAKPLPTGAALQDFWRSRLPYGEMAILEALISAYPSCLLRDELNSVGFKRSTRDEYLSRLNKRQLIQIDRDSGVRASPNLFS